MKRSAFTLIELLVVIAIIAILAAILFPVFASAREKVRQTTCASNEKQIGLALLQYVQDFDEIEPPIAWSNVALYSNVTRQTWMDIVYPYVKSQGVFTCPDDTSPTSTYTYGGNVPAATTTNKNYGSYTANDLYDNPRVSTGPTPVFSSQVIGYNTSSAKIASPSTTAYVLETDSNPGVPGGNIYDWQFSQPGTNPLAIDSTTGKVRLLDYAASPGNYGVVVERHTGTTNVLWCDGHVKSVKLDLLATPGTGGVMTYFTCEADPF